MHPRLVLSAGNFFGAIYFSLVLTVFAPYLALFLAESQIGLVVALGGAITLALFPFMPRLVRKFGSRHMAIWLSFTAAVLLSVLALAPSAPFAIACVALICAIAPFIAYQMDLLLQAATSEPGSIGRVRTLFITGASLAYVIGPLIVGFLLDGTEAYWRVFLAASLSLTPFIAIFLFEKLPEAEPPAFHTMLATCSCLWTDKDLRAAALGSGVLQFFFHLAPFYIPLYLHSVLGFPWESLGWIFAIMVLPFLFVEYPAGYIADRWLGDKELMIAGFIIMGVAFAIIGFITPATPLLLIAALLFATRVGAALVESMVESHFFRRVSGRDVTTISVFRMMRPVGAIIAPLFASALLLTGNYVAFFMVSGAIIVALGIVATFSLKDVR
ncbi:MAG TPA: MFS transporter [Candidatus Paceibacterota bacterium]|nr:MFS transporter [Candidatus Paceibacterota bacterium]